jgi:mRNA interferase YafQ
MKTVSQTTQFARDVKLMRRRGKDLGKLQAVVRLLATGTGLPRKQHDHALAGSWQPSRDCHIEPDWILIYTADADSLRLERTGSHSDLFRN